MIMSTEDLRRRKQRELDSILDAALDELDDDDSCCAADGDEEDDARDVNVTTSNNLT